MANPGILTRIRWFTKIYFVKLMAAIYKVFLRFSKHQPTYKKTYKVLPGIENYVFLPPNYSQSQGPLPLLIDIHGGGFNFGYPDTDSIDNVKFASHGICVVAISYRLAPWHKFPTAVYDVAMLIDAVINDPDLPIDRSKVAVAGFSAGGNLALAGPQLNGLHDKIKGVVSFYPNVDIGRGLEARLKTAVAPPGRSDILQGISDIFHWSYFPKNVNLKDPLLAPFHADRAKLPEKIYIFACEYDILCTEDEEAAERYAARESQFGRGGDRTPLQGVNREGWREGNVTFEKLLGVEHGFNQRLALERDPKVKARWAERTDSMHQNVIDWLFREVYA